MEIAKGIDMHLVKHQYCEREMPKCMQDLWQKWYAFEHIKQLQ